jgi:hypothetical protein
MFLVNFLCVADTAALLGLDLPLKLDVDRDPMPIISRPSLLWLWL